MDYDNLKIDFDNMKKDYDRKRIRLHEFETEAELQMKRHRKWKRQE